MEAKGDVSDQNFQDQLLSTKIICTRGTGGLDKGQRQEETGRKRGKGTKNRAEKRQERGKVYFIQEWDKRLLLDREEETYVTHRQMAAYRSKMRILMLGQDV